MAEYNGKKGRWITYEGRHIFIADGEDFDTAFEKATGHKVDDNETRKEKQIERNKKEADELNREKNRSSGKKELTLDDFTKEEPKLPKHVLDMLHGKDKDGKVIEHAHPSKEDDYKDAKSNKLSKEELQKLVHKYRDNQIDDNIKERVKKADMENANEDNTIHGKPHFSAPKDKVFNEGALKNGYYRVPEGYHTESVTDEQAYQDAMNQYNKVVARLKAEGDNAMPPKPTRGLFNGGGWVRLVRNR